MERKSYIKPSLEIQDLKIETTLQSLSISYRSGGGEGVSGTSTNPIEGGAKALYFVDDDTEDESAW